MRHITPSPALVRIKFWEIVRQAQMAWNDVNLKEGFCYTSKTYLTEVAYCETTEAGHKTWMKSSPVLRATVLIRLLTSTRDKLDARLCSIGWQTGGMETSSHSLHPVPATSTTLCSNSTADFQLLIVTNTIHINWHSQSGTHKDYGLLRSDSS